MSADWAGWPYFALHIRFGRRVAFCGGFDTLWEAQEDARRQLREYSWISPADVCVHFPRKGGFWCPGDPQQLYLFRKSAA